MTNWTEQIKKQENFAGTIQKGVILLADISGYTTLVTQLELEHARGIIFELINSICKVTGDDFIINEIEGDAVFAYCINPPNPGRLLEVTTDQIERYKMAFDNVRDTLAERQRTEPDACNCGACSRIGILDIKFVLHYGEFGLNQIGPFVKLVGGSVILAHRLLKNSVPSKSYILMTEETYVLIPKSIHDKFESGLEKIEHFGEIKTRYRLLT